MTGLLTILAILISAYSLLPDEKRLDLYLRISWADLFLAAVPIIAILVVVYSPVILSTGYVKPVAWYWGFTEETMVFSCLLGIVGFFGWKASGSRLPLSNYARWDEATHQYLRSKKFHQLGYVLNKYHDQLFKVIEKDVWYVRVHRFLKPRPAILSLVANPKVPFYKPWLDRIRTLLARPFPGSCKSQERISQSVSRLLKSPSFVEFMAETHPMVAAKATKVRLPDSEEYISLFFKSLIAHPGSVLYRELRDNQNCSYTGEYYLDESNALLGFYLRDVEVAQEVGIWQSVGEYVIDFIKKQRGQDNFYNKPNDGFSDGDERWNCPIFIGGLFFEVMVSVAIFQRAQDHMWLMYVDSFLEKILDSMDRAPEVDPDREFPSRFDYLMYELFSACGKWAGAAEYLDYSNVDPADIEHFPEYWAAKTYGSMLRRIVKSGKLPDRQKAYFLEIALRQMRALDQKDLRLYSRLILNNCLKEYEVAAVDQRVVTELRDLYNGVDHVLKSSQSTFETEMAKYP
ncbi:hypothetical protein [Spongiibacter marinus]|uniref:hypothetical protein n=1 Tax=Spongiibacter marinus TaxID=354246 RepID=UPI003561821C